MLLVLPADGPRAEESADERTCRKEQNLDLAYAACTRALASPDLDRKQRNSALYNRAVILTQQRRRRDAIADYSEILKDDPRDHEVWNERGRLHRMLGSHGEAIRDFSEAIKLVPDDAAYLSNRGLAYKQSGNYDRALADYDESLRLDPDSDVTLHNRGLLHRLLENYPQALADLERSLALDPDDDSTMKEIGLTYADLGRHAEAVAYFDRAIAQSPDYGEAWFGRGLSYGRLGNHDLALSDLKRAEALGVRDPELRAAIGSESRIVGLGRVLETITPPAGGSPVSDSAGTPAGQAPPANPDFDMGDELNF